MVSMHIYVEGGGDSKSLRTELRKGFSEFLEQAGFIGHMPKIVACGGRQNAFEHFCTAVKTGAPAMLLVDSEAPVADKHQNQPWRHLAERVGDGWEKPANADDSDCHLMVQCMEAWLIADRQTLQKFFGQDFHANSLPAEKKNIESIPKQRLYSSLENATRKSKKGKYGKGSHSFKLLATTDPNKVTAASPWAKRFVDTLKVKMGC